MTQGSLHFPLDKPLPKGLLKKLIRVRLDQIEEKSRKGTGPALTYYDNAVLQSKGKFRKGELHGPWQWWRKDGTLMRSGEFKSGVQVGTWWTYDQQGRQYKSTKFS
jgi:antitoxin component YwqK of YwqJK toxin-antitoxin module